jgi:hypothetical protein
MRSSGRTAAESRNWATGDARTEEASGDNRMKGAWTLLSARRVQKARAGRRVALSR